MKLGAPASGPDFFGRNQVVADLWRYLESEHIRFPGVRRLGKTSILIRLLEQAAEHGVFARKLDVSAIDAAERFVELLEQTFPKNLIARFVEGSTQPVANWLRRVRKIDAQLPSTVGGGGVGLELADGQPSEWLKKAEALRGRLADQPLLILIDEFPVMLQTLLAKNPQEARQLLAWLRIWRQSAGHCRFVFTGSIGLQSLLERHGLADKMNDCYDYPLGPFRFHEARDLWRAFAPMEDETPWHADDAVIEHALARIGWLSPYFVCLLLDESIRAARERRQEQATPADAAASLQIDDVDDAYDKLLAVRSRFHHWEERLRKALPPADLGFCLALLTELSRHADGLTLRQLSSRLSKHEGDPEVRAQRLQDLLVRLSDEGYTSVPDAEKRVQFLSFPLRDWWHRNHV
jgi:hypothetical protein